MRSNRHYIRYLNKSFVVLQQGKEDKIKIIRIVESWYDTMPIKISWQPVLDVIDGPIVDIYAIGMKIPEYLLVQNY